MNPLTKEQKITLGKLNCNDLARKIDEIIAALNEKKEKKDISFAEYTITGTLSASSEITIPKSLLKKLL